LARWRSIAAARGCLAWCSRRARRSPSWSAAGLATLMLIVRLIEEAPHVRHPYGIHRRRLLEDRPLAETVVHDLLTRRRLSRAPWRGRHWSIHRADPARRRALRRRQPFGATLGVHHGALQVLYAAVKLPIVVSEDEIGELARALEVLTAALDRRRRTRRSSPRTVARAQVAAHEHPRRGGAL